METLALRPSLQLADQRSQGTDLINRKHNVWNKIKRSWRLYSACAFQRHNVGFISVTRFTENHWQYSMFSGCIWLIFHKAHKDVSAFEALQIICPQPILHMTGVDATVMQSLTALKTQSQNKALAIRSVCLR